MNKKIIDSTFNIYAIGNAHIDPVWRWNKREGYQEVFATFRSVLDRMKEFPNICFAASSAQFYEWIAEAAPDMLEEIKSRIQEGRWILVGGWWVESDANCPSGESLVRQGLYAQKFFNKHFGRKAQIGFSPDTFGHAWTLPQILKKQDMDAYFYMRPEPHEKNDLLAPLFLWQGPDKSSVMAISIFTSYTATEHEIEDRIGEYSERFSHALPEVKDIALFYGVGNHGGGPTIAAIKKIEGLRNKLPGIRFASPEKYVDKIRLQLDKLPILCDELQHHARGCYSACADVKLWDRQTSSALIYAEKTASLAYIIANGNYPTKALRDSWKKVLFNQFHDILAGTSIEEAYDDADKDYGYAMSVARDITMKAMLSLSLKIDTSNPDFPLSLPFIVYNPCSWTVNKYVEFETELLNLSTCGSENTFLRNSEGEPFPKHKIVLRDSNGKSVPYQILKTAAAKQENHPFRIRILFKAEIPSVGYHVYRLDFSKKEDPPNSDGLKITEDTLENNLVRIQFDRKTGAISSYFDKNLNRELFKHHGAVPIVLDDWDDTWGHQIRAYDDEVGRFGNASFKIIENGPERVRTQIKSFWGDSFIVQEFTLYKDTSELDCKISIDWHEKYCVLKLSFPTILEKGKCTYSIPYGFIEREMNGDEEPGQEWIDVSSMDETGGFGFAIINDSKCGYSVKNGDIRLTIFHSTAWSHHNPEIVEENDNCRYMEQGIHEFTYKLVPHSGDWRIANIPQKGEEKLLPPLVFHANQHKGELTSQNSFISTNLNNLSITVIKKAEESDGLVLRCVELHGHSARGTIVIKTLKRQFSFTIDTCEIKTFLVPLVLSEDVQEVNLLEE